MIERHLCTTFKLRTNSFCRHRAGLEVFDKSDIIENNTIRNQFFVKLFLLSFYLSAFEVTFIKPSNPTLCRQKEFVLNLKVVHKCRSIIDPFPANHCSAFFYSRSFFFALYSDDSSWQVSDEKLRKY